MDEKSADPNPWTRLEAAGQVLDRMQLLGQLQQHHPAPPNVFVLGTVMGVLSNQLDVALGGDLDAVEVLIGELGDRTTWATTAAQALWADPL